MSIALYHFHVTQIKRSAGQSVVAAAAYRAGEKLHSNYYGEDVDYTRKCGVVHTEILLPSHALPVYADRETLWNAVEQAEKHPKAQLAYSFDIALQNEFSMVENITLARQFLLEHFVSRGMIVDFSVHDPNKNGGISNPHIHIMSPIRPLNNDGSWGAKQRRVYELDEHGNRIRDEAGNYVFNAVPTTDWGSPETLEHWRKAWAEMCNAKFAEKRLHCSIDHRSYERQGIKQLPTIHEGPTVRAMEAKGIRTEKGELNQWIKATNNMIRSIERNIAKLMDWLQETTNELVKPKVSGMGQLLGEYYTGRNAGAYTDKARVNNLKQYAEEVAFLESKELLTLEQFQGYVSSMSGTVHDTNKSLQMKAARMKELKNLIRLADDYARLKPIVDAIPPKGGWGRKHEKYIEIHDSEIRQFYAVKRKLDNAELPDKKLMPGTWQKELDKLTAEYADEQEKLKSIQAEMKKLREIQHKADAGLCGRQRSHEKQRMQETEL